MKNILQGIGIVFTLVVSFLGLMYMLKGDVLLSSLFALVIIVIQFFLIEKFIRSKSEITKNKFSTLSVLLWTIYLLLAIPVSIFLMHALNVEINAKKSTQQLGNTKFTELGNMIRDFDAHVDKCLTSFSIDLSNKLNRYAAGSPPDPVLEKELQGPPFNLSPAQLADVNSTNVDNTVKNLIKAKNTKIKPAVDTVRSANEVFTKRYGGVFDNWSRFHVNYAFYELDTRLAQTRASLARADSVYLPFAADRFAPVYSTEDALMEKPLQLFSKYKPYYLIAVVLIFHLLILLPYIIQPVSGSYVRPKGTQSGGGQKL